MYFLYWALNKVSLTWLQTKLGTCSNVVSYWLLTQILFVQTSFSYLDYSNNKKFDYFQKLRLVNFFTIGPTILQKHNQFASLLVDLVHIVLKRVVVPKSVFLIDRDF